MPGLHVPSGSSVTDPRQWRHYGATRPTYLTVYPVGRGHTMAFVHILHNGPPISAKHIGTSGTCIPLSSCSPGVSQG